MKSCNYFSVNYTEIREAVRFGAEQSVHWWIENFPGKTNTTVTIHGRYGCKLGVWLQELSKKDLINNDVKSGMRQCENINAE